MPMRLPDKIYLSISILLILDMQWITFSISMSQILNGSYLN